MIGYARLRLGIVTSGVSLPKPKDTRGWKESFKYTMLPSTLWITWHGVHAPVLDVRQQPNLALKGKEPVTTDRNRVNGAPFDILVVMEWNLWLSKVSINIMSYQTSVIVEIKILKCFIPANKDVNTAHLGYGAGWRPLDPWLLRPQSQTVNWQYFNHMFIRNHAGVATVYVMYEENVKQIAI